MLKRREFLARVVGGSAFTLASVSFNHSFTLMAFAKDEEVSVVEYGVKTGEDADRGKHLLNATSYRKELALRRAEYLNWIVNQFGAMEARMEPTDGRLWALQHARLVQGKELDKANLYFESISLPGGDIDIFFIRFLKTLLDFADSPRLTTVAKARLIGILKSWPSRPEGKSAQWPAIHTENHDLTFLTIELFARKFRGQDVSSICAEIKKHLAWRVERGWVEWNSPCYQFHYSNPLIVLADHAPTPDLRQAAQDVFNLMLAERALLGINGYLGGPKFRCRTADAHHSLTARKVAYLEDNRYDGFLPTVWLAFGLGEPRFDFDKARVPGLLPATTAYASGNEPRLKQDEGMFFATSALEPHPVVVALAREVRSRKVLIYEGQRYLGWPDDPLWATQKWIPARLCYYNTPHVSMGSVHSDGWICQTRYNNITFAADPSQNLRVEIILPGVPPHKRRYEARGRVVQHKNWLLAQGTLFEDGGIRATRYGDWNIYRVGKGLCAHAALPESYHLLQVSDLDTYATVEAFVSALTMPRFENGWVIGTTTDGDHIAVNVNDMSIIINDITRPHPPRMLHDCDLMHSEYGSGRVTITTSEGTVTFDSTTWQ